MRLKNFFIAAAFIASLAAQAGAADILITVNGTITSAEAGTGYAVNDSVSLFWLVNDYAPQTPIGSGGESRYDWQEESASDPQLWANVGGTGIGGTYMKAPDSGPYEKLEVSTSVTNNFETWMGTDGTVSPTNNHGIYLNANPSYWLSNITFEGKIDTVFAFPGSPQSPVPYPTDYLANYLGTYNVTSQVSGRITASNGSQFINAFFAATTVTIAQVPEPSTYVLGGIGVLTIGWISRRRAAKRNG